MGLILSHKPAHTKIWSDIIKQSYTCYQADQVNAQHRGAADSPAAAHLGPSPYA